MVAVCDDDPTVRVELVAEDVIVLRVQTGSLRKHLATALDIQISRRPAVALPGVLPIGLLEAAPSVAFPVVLVCHPDARVVGTLVRETVLADKRPTLVLTPTDDAWTEELREWVEGRGSTLVPADDVVEIGPDGRWAATDLWPPFRAAFLKRAGFNAKAVKGNTRKGRGGRDKELRAHSVSVGKALRTLIGNQRVHVRNELNKGVTEIQLPRITQAQIAKIAGGGCKDYHITRIRKSGRYPTIVLRLDALNDVVKLRNLPRR